MKTQACLLASGPEGRSEGRTLGHVQIASPRPTGPQATRECQLSFADQPNTTVCPQLPHKGHNTHDKRNVYLEDGGEGEETQECVKICLTSYYLLGEHRWF